METPGKHINSSENRNFHPAFLADVTMEDIAAACDKGMGRYKFQQFNDGSGQLLLYGQGAYGNCILHRLNVCPEGRVYFDIIYYLSVVKGKKNIPPMIREFENTVKMWLKADK